MHELIFQRVPYLFTMNLGKMTRILVTKKEHKGTQPKSRMGYKNNLDLNLVRKPMKSNYVEDLDLAS